MNRFNLLILLFVMCLFLACTKKEISLSSLLVEMTDKSSVSYFPEQDYQIKQFSSYDRKSVSPDNKDWWANADYTQFIREENKNDRREFVLFDADGPGAVVRYWMTFAGEGSTEGILRIYIDNNEIPAVEGNVLDILSGNVLAQEPLASSVSPETDYHQRGHNLYLPIPYSVHCKITYECDAVKFENSHWSPSIYYNINYREYHKGTKVESFSLEVLQEAKSLVAETSKTLLAANAEEKFEFEKHEKLKESEGLSIGIPGKGKAISKIKLKIDAVDLNQALRSTVLAISFDQNETIWVPVGDFFGTGYQIKSSKTWYTSVNDLGVMEASWIMPFKNDAHIQVINYGNQEVDVNLKIATNDYRWKKSSMYFGASWHEFNQISTASDENIENHEWHYDVNYVDVKGQGVYVGDALTVFNTVDAWWGEGDEKIYVDGEIFPSCIGTGTEDYYGYAWCRPEEFSHPFIAQPSGAGNFHPGMSVNMRYRALDAMPFTTEISSNIEMWHWVKTKINYAMTAFWYAKPGFQSNVSPAVDAVKLPVALQRSDIYKPIVDKDGMIEGEHLEVISFRSGTVTTQSGDFGWSGDTQLWWRGGETGNELITKFILNETAKYEFSLHVTKAIDYGIVQFYLNGIPLGKKVNCFYKTGVIPFQLNLGKQVLSEGENIFSVKIVGADKDAKPGNMVGIDFLKFEKVN